MSATFEETFNGVAAESSEREECSEDDGVERGVIKRQKGLEPGTIEVPIIFQNSGDNANEQAGQ